MTSRGRRRKGRRRRGGRGGGNEKDREADENEK